MNKPYGVVFLDLDGVLNSRHTKLGGCNNCRLDSSLMRRLKTFLDDIPYQVDIVLITDWKNDWEKDYNKCTPPGKYIVKRFRSVGLSVFDKVPEIDWRKRAKGIKTYLKEHDNITNYVIFDDWDFDYDLYDLSDHFVQTDVEEGLSEEDIKKARLLF